MYSKNERYLSLAVIMFMLCFYSLAEFIEVPSPVTLEIGSGSAMFRCSHQLADGIGWRLNGLPVRDFPNITTGSTNENGAVVVTLSIPARSQYNGTEVVCVAFILGESSELTPPITLLLTVTAPTTFNLMPPEVTTTPQPPSAEFDTTPSSLNVTVEQQVVSFHCQHRSSNDITWTVNGTSYNSPDISVNDSPLDDGGFRSSLSINTLLGFNETKVQCVAIIVNPSAHLELAAPVILLIQDTPGEVTNAFCERNHSSNTLTIVWDSLPSLDLTDIDPDIVYTVELFKTTCGQNVPIKYEIMAENSTTVENLDLMQIYKAVVAARNNVTGANNGPNVEMNETFMSLSGFTLFKLARNFQLSFMSQDPVPSYYIMNLESIDGLGQNLAVNITVERNGNNVNMHMEEMLQSKSLWKASILPYGCDADTIVTELSTHHIQNITASSPLPGQIRITGDFIDGSAATGLVLLIIYSLNNESDVLYIATQKTEQNIHIDVVGLPGTEFQVSVFALEDGKPFPRVVASPKYITVATNSDQEGTPQQLTSLEYKLHSTSTGVCITCTFLDSSTTDCVVVVHQQISQLSSSGLMNIESSHKFNRSASSDTVYGCIEGVNMEQYHIGVINGKRIIPITEPSVSDKDSSLAGTIVGAVLGIIVFALIVEAVVVIIFIRKRAIAQESRYSEAVPPSRSDIVNMESGYNSNIIESAPPREEETERPTEEQPFFTPPRPPRMTADDVSILPLTLRKVAARVMASGSADHETSNRPTPVQETLGSDSNDPTYATAVLLSLSNPVPPPAVTEKLVYDDIQGFQNQEGQLYAIPQLKYTSKGVPDDFCKVEYSEIQPQQKTQSEHSSPDNFEQNSIVSPPALGSLTVQQLYCHLLPLCSKWQLLGEALSLDEDHLDEIYTNNETDEACLREILELYMMRSDRNYSWEKIETAEKKVKEAVDQKQCDCGVEIPQKKSEKEQPAEVESLDNICPDSGHYSQSVPGGDCEFQCSLSTCISASPTSASQADEDGNISVDIQKSDSSPESSALNGSTSSDLCASISSEKTSHVPDSTTNPATTSWYEEAIEEKDVYNLNCDGSHNQGQSVNSFGDKQSDKESLQKGNGPSDYSQTVLSDIEHSNNVAPSSQGEYPESKWAATSTEQSGSSECGDAASNASGDDFSINQDATPSWYEEAMDVYNLNCDGHSHSGNSFGDKQSNKESLQKGNGPSDYSQTVLSDIEHSNNVAPSSQGEYPESKLDGTSTGQSGSSECGDAASNASGDDFSINQDEYGSDHMHPSGKEAAQLNSSAAPCIPTPTDPTKNKDLHQENINDVDRIPSNVFDVEIPCTCSSMNSYRYSQLKKFGLVVAEDYQDNEGPCKLDPVYMYMYCQESSEDQTKINYETSLRKFFKIETINQVMTKRSDVVNESSEGIIEDLNKDIEVVEKLSEDKGKESSAELVEGSEETVKTVELCKEDDVVEQYVDPEELESHGEQVELCEVQSKLNKKQLVVCCSSWKPVKNWSLPKHIGLCAINLTLHSQSNDTLSKATIHDEICTSPSMPSVQKPMWPRFCQRSPQDLQDYQHTCKHTHALVSKQTSKWGFTSAFHTKVQNESSTEFYTNNCATASALLANHFARNILDFHNNILACMHAISLLCSIINIHFFLKFGVAFYTNHKTVLIINNYMVISC